ncbi:uncharacterized protein DUF4282 [Isoptericola jiangsuensis]|uniref:Uncharacterized protein DUF4282 n=1 Tax=Isoptericola jiangsuensis TaxID=548579 RepID=A0A2A9EZE9_9MICO|nr:DUF4282 domain-containing protein [Isoptericola jiangsuensis]PFG43640.1 uncharacterized protein DUF4282 [Isoptericola jiangsuensis]
MSQNTPNPPGEPTDPYGRPAGGEQPGPYEPPAQPYQEPSGTYQQPGEPHQQQGFPQYQQPVGERPVGEQPFYAAAASSAAGVARDDTKGLLGSLFDFSFMNYVTPKIVKIVYVVVTVLIAISWLFWFIYGVVTLFSDQWYVGLGIILFGWIIALVYLAIWRIGLEVFQAVVNISEKVNRYAHRDGLA